MLTHSLWWGGIFLINPPLCWGWLGLRFWRSHPFYSQTMFFSDISLRFICKLLVDWVDLFDSLNLKSVVPSHFPWPIGTGRLEGLKMQLMFILCPHLWTVSSLPFLQWPISDGNAEDLGRQSKTENHIILTFSPFSGPPWDVELQPFMAVAAAFWRYIG